MSGVDAIGGVARELAAPGRREARGSDAVPQRLRWPEMTQPAPVDVPVLELRNWLATLATRRFAGYVTLDRRAGQAPGAILLYEGQPIQAAAGSLLGPAALRQLLATTGPTEVRCHQHALATGVVLALAATLAPPRLTQSLGNDASEVALLLRELAGVKHTGLVELSAARSANWLRVLMHEGKFLGVYSATDRALTASLAEVASLLASPGAHLTLFALAAAPPALELPALTPPRAANATPERDALLEADLVWFLSRFERAFGRLKERRDAQADTLRAFAELVNELAALVVARVEEPAPAAAQRLVALELERVHAGATTPPILRLGKAGLDAGAVAKGYTAYARRDPAATAYFQAATGALLALVEGLLERLLAEYYDPGAAAQLREGCETLLREVRGRLPWIAAAGD